MRLSLLFVSILVSATATAQVTSVTGGCNPWNGTPGTPFAVAGEEPRIGNTRFAMAYNPPPFGTLFCYWALGGDCETGNPDFPPALLCGGPPCRVAVDLTRPVIIGGALLPPYTVVTPLPIPNDTQLIGLEWCIQYLAFANYVCTEISQGAKIAIMQ